MRGRGPGNVPVGPCPIGVGICAAAGNVVATTDRRAKPPTAARDFADMTVPLHSHVAIRPSITTLRVFSPAETLYNKRMADATSDPLGFRRLKAPSLAELDVLAGEIFRHLPRRFRDLCVDLVIQVEDFPTEDVLDQMGAESEFDLLGLFQGVGLPFRAESAPVQMPNMIWLYRRPILDYWAEHDETLGAIVKHVLIHEIGHHFGLSDADMAAIERSAEETKGAFS
jgi:predicted Zn-dependent protease with MMP-like domain